MNVLMNQTFDQCTGWFPHHSEILLLHDDTLPEMLEGNLDFFRLVVHALAEFSIKYSQPKDQILVNTSFVTKLDEEDTI